MDDGEGLVLNLALPDAGPARTPSRSQQRKEKWHEKRLLKKHAHKGQQHGVGGNTPGWLSSGGQQRGRQAQQGAPPGSAGAGQLKGYSLEDYEPPAAPAPAPAPPKEQRPPAQQPKPAADRSQPPSGGSLPGPGAGASWAAGAPQEQQQRAQAAPQAQREQRRAQAAPEAQQRPRPQDTQQPPSSSLEQQEQQQRDRGARLAAEHNQRRQQRHRPSAGPGAPAAGGPAAAAVSPAAGAAGGGASAQGPRLPSSPKAAGGGRAAAGEDAESKRIGRLRLASRQAGYREATPDLDELPGAGSDADEGDVAAAVAAAIARDRAVQAELASAQRARFARFGGGSDGEEDGEADNEQVAGKWQRQGKRAGKLDCFAGSSSGEEGGGRQAGTVDFGGGDYGEQVRQRAAKRRRKEASAAAAAAAEKAGGKAKAPAVNVRPGELVHAGAAAANGAAARGAGSAGGGSAGSGFGGLGLSEQLAGHLAAHGFVDPTRVQQQAIPVLLARRDALINAPTGSGKTLSYLAPIVHDLASQLPPITRSQGTFAAIICPTRELCLQVADVLTLLVRRFVWLVGGAVHGGEDRGKEKARLRKGVTILVATPGRLLDHLENTQAFRTEELRWLVLDEADRLLDLGFEKKISQICAELDRRSSEADYLHRRTTALLSATLHSNLGSLAALSLRDPAAIGFSYRVDKEGRMVVAKEAGKEAEAEGRAGGGKDAAAWAAAAMAAAGGDGRAAGPAAALERFEIPAQLKQRFVEVPCKLRLVALGALLRARLAAGAEGGGGPGSKPGSKDKRGGGKQQGGGSGGGSGSGGRCKMVVFLSTTDSVEYYHAVFTQAWEPATGERLLLGSPAPILKLHGNMPQAERTQAFLEFSRCPSGVLLCTDVAARGLDFPAVTDIVQFDPPGEAAEYVHRVGRTARLGTAGSALLFLLPSERGYVEHLGSHGVGPLREQPAVPLLNAVLGADRKAGKDLPLERHQGAYALQKQLMEAVGADRRLLALGGDAFRSWVRAYATHPAAVKEVFHVRRLHLGHVAHAFALQERPSLVGKSAAKQSSQAKRKAQHAPGGGGKRAKPGGGGKSSGRPGGRPGGGKPSGKHGSKPSSRPAAGGGQAAAGGGSRVWHTLA